MARRVRRMLLAYAMQYDDGSLEFSHVLECESFEMHYRPHTRGGRMMWDDDDMLQAYTVGAMGRTLHEWPTGWRHTDDVEPAAIAPPPLALPAPQEETP